MAERDGVEWRWREARAIGLSIIASHAERALAQFEPRFATDALPFYRELYQLPQSASDSEVRSTADALSHLTRIEQSLKNIDSRFSVLTRAWETETTTVPGRAFEDWAKTKPFNLKDGRGDTLYPNYSTAFDMTVLFDIGDQPPTGFVESGALATARALLDDELPAWCGYSIIGAVGFVLGKSQLGWTGFGP